jgi:hypothetical protein
MKLLVVVPGIGNPNFDIKEKFLQHNLDIIKNTFSGQVDTLLFNFSNNQFTHDHPNIIKKPGIIGEFLYNQLDPSKIEGYDWTITLIEDIELSSNINIDKMINIYQKFNLNILSPSMTKDSKINHSFMVENDIYNNVIRIVNFCEWFFYLMDKNSYIKYWNILDKDSKWLWGLDLCLYNLGFNMALINDYKMKHHYSTSDIYNKNKFEEMRSTKSKHRSIKHKENIIIHDVCDLI